jgi:hypothetical protein
MLVMVFLASSHNHWQIVQAWVERCGSLLWPTQLHHARKLHSQQTPFQ